MAKFELKEGQVILFKQEDVKEKQPIYKGFMNWQGEEIELALWISESKKGLKYFSGRAQKPKEKEDKEPEVKDGLPF